MLRWGHVKRAAWTGIMRSALERYLRRAVHDDEIAALITVWRFDGNSGMATRADEVMREAFSRFRNEVPDRAMQACARRRIALQWYRGARIFARRGHPIEAMKYLGHAARWVFTPRTSATA